MSGRESCVAISETTEAVRATREAACDGRRWISAKIQRKHTDRLAVVYVRQSTPQQVVEHRESLARQYALREHALGFGWNPDRIVIIDEDLGLSGRSAEGRSGFQRLLTEVAMDHVGLVLALEMSRLARSNKDWHHLLELCGIFQTLLADQDGVYDPSDPNDRLLLGLRGTMSELELHTMRNRMGKGLLNKAQRGELFLNVPAGYVKTPDGGIALEPDEQARAVIHLIFDKFDELGSCHALLRYLHRHDIRLGIRPIDGPDRGQLVWRHAYPHTVLSMLKHPLYAGMYVFGRHLADPKRRATHKVARRWVDRGEYRVLLPDRVPAYITPDQYERNVARLRENRSRLHSKGSPRKGTALSSGIVFCGNCGLRLATIYGRTGHARYACVGHFQTGGPPTCRGLSAAPIDALVTQQVLRALEPASLELAVAAVENTQQERRRLREHWKQKLERANYESELASRQYRAVDPENRLVARTLEQQWETALRKKCRLAEEFDRFDRETPAGLSPEEQQTIRRLASNIPALWQAPSTSVQDKKEIIRTLVERVVVHVRNNTEHVDVTIHWCGGYVSPHAITRPVRKSTQLEDYDRIVAVITEGHEQGLTAREIAERLNGMGFNSPVRGCRQFNKHKVNHMRNELGLSRPLLSHGTLAPDEWRMTEFCRELGVTKVRVQSWIRYGFLHARKGGGKRNFWILWADAEELCRLRELRDYQARERVNAYPPHLRQPKPRPDHPMNSDGQNAA